MKYLVVVLFLLASTSVVVAQEDVKIIEITEDTVPESVPFAVIEKVPIYPGCTGDDNEILKKCMSGKISAHISNNFDIIKAAKGLPAGTHRVVITFKIDKEGHITNIKSRGPNKTSEIEAVKAIEGLPQMIPGQQKGKNVGVLYALPISFSLENEDADPNKKG